MSSYEEFTTSRENRRLLSQEQLILDVTENILELLEKKGLTQTDLAHRLQRSKSHVSKLLSGERNMTLRTLSDLGFALNQAVDIEFSTQSRQAATFRNIVSIDTWKDRRMELRYSNPVLKTSNQSTPTVQGLRP